ncbi:uncharacterized protein LOC141900020 isoform X2 [Tubulanus polymorphus]|uniref:uncharacterized protein LOC141900020 isoform X2 n=1 Tax=Tubulanus polymorphus TaxID=672921 RepID=UPI003DA3B25C
MASKVAIPAPFVTVPTDISYGKPGQLSEEQIKHYFEEGYVIVRDYLTPDELEPCKRGIAEIVDGLAKKLFRHGKISELHEEAGVFHRLTLLEQDFPGAFALIFKAGELHQSFRDLWENEKLLNMVEQLIGPEVSGHPVWNLRPKVPQNSATTVPWHQDSAYFSEDSYGHLIPTTWIPFLDTDSRNGGMQVLKRGHQKGIVVDHTCCWEDTWYLETSEQEMKANIDAKFPDDVITCEVPYGGFLLFNNIIPHRSLPNNSNDVRWSIDLRWQSPKKPWGFYNIQEGAAMRDKNGKKIAVDWKKFMSVNRKEVWQQRYNKQMVQDDQFSTIVTGPWIGRWKISHENRHTNAFENFTKSS